MKSMTLECVLETQTPTQTSFGPMSNAVLLRPDCRDWTSMPLRLSDLVPDSARPVDPCLHPRDLRVMCTWKMLVLKPFHATA